MRLRHFTIAGFIVIVIIATSGCGRGTNETPTAGPPSMTATASLSDITAGSGLERYEHKTGAAGEFLFPESMGPGVGVIDYNNDGAPDLLVTGGGEWAGSDWNSVWLFRNDGDLQFTDVTTEAGLLQSQSYSMGIATTDYDGDGWEDFLVTSISGVQLYRNAGGTFEEATTAAGLSIDQGWSTSAAFFDADSDGDSDLLVGHYVKWEDSDDDLWCSNDGTDKTYCTPTIYQGESLRFYANDRGSFTDVTEQYGFDVGSGKTLGIVVGDFSGDNHPDLYVANDTEPDQLFVRDSDLPFDEIGLASGVAFDERGRSRAGMGVDFGVIDNSGATSLVVGNFAEEMIGVYQSVGAGIFVDRSAALKIGLASLNTLTFGLALVDVNLDGALDLVAANGHIQPEIARIRDNVTYAESPHVFINNRDETFTDIVVQNSELADPMVARGMTYADFDRDGDPDLVFVENSGGLRLWRNHAVEDGQSGIVIRLRDNTSSGSASAPVVGATVELFSNGISQKRSIKSGGSYLSSFEKAAHFALAGNHADSVRVKWPDGSMQLETELPTAAFATIDKSTGAYE